MKVSKNIIGGLFWIILIIGAMVLFQGKPAWASGETCSNGQSAPCFEDLLINGCLQCHSLQIEQGNRNGTDRFITASVGTLRHIHDPLIADWTSIVQAMIGKNSPGTLELAAGYLNTNYCPACTGPILGSPVQSNVTQTTATVTWSSSANGFEDEPTSAILYYTKTPSDMFNVGTAVTTTNGNYYLFDPATFNCVNTCQQIADPGPTAHHVVNLTGLSASTRYYLVAQVTSALGTTRSTYAYSFKTKPPIGGTTPPMIFLSENEATSGTENDRIIVIDPNPLKPDHVTPNPDYNKQVLPSVAITGKDPTSIVSNPNGKAVYAMVGPRLSAIDTSSSPFLENISIGGAGDFYNHLAVSPDGNTLYLAYHLNVGTPPVAVKVYDVTDPINPALTATITDPAFNGCNIVLGLGISPDGSQLYLPCSLADDAQQDRMYMIDIASQTVTLTATYTRAIGVPYVNAVAVSSDGTSVYLARGGSSGSGSTVEVFDGTSGANAGSIPLPDPSTPTAGVFSADGTKLYVSDIRAGIRVIDTGSNTLTLTMAGPTSRGYDIGITPDDARLYTTFISNVYVNDTGTNSPITTITGDYTNVYNLTVSPGQAGPPSPDVVMTDVTPNASSVAAGGTLSVSDTVKNQGTASTDSAFFIGYVLSPTTDYNDPGAVAITTTRAVGPLAPPDTDTATTDLLIPSTTPPGTYHVCALADSTQALSESNVDNNTKCSDATVQVSRPDLIMTAVTPNSTSFTPGGTLSVTDTVQNQGGAPTTVSFTIAYRLSPEPPTAPCNLGPSGATTAPPSCYVDSNAVTISTTRTVGLLAAGASSMATTSLLIPGSTAPGNYHVCAFADSTNAVGGEIDENNNMSCSSITVGPAVPDLIMTATSTAATAVAPGSNFTLSNTVKNQGGAAAGSFAIAFHLSTNTTYGDGDDIAFTATRSVGSLSAGASSSASTSLNVPASTPLGNYYVCVMADSNNTVNEGSPTNENNNTRCTAATINVTRPDLIMTAVTPNSGTVSTTATLSVTNSAKNQGVVSAGSSKVGFVLSLTANYDDPGAIAITTTRTISTLAAGATSTGTTNLAIPKTTPPDNYYVCAKADSAGTVTELDETNNTLCSPGTVVVPPPDLVMTAASTTTTVVAPGKALSLSNTVQNQGLFPAGAFAVAFHLSTDTTYGNGDDIAFTTTRSVTSLNSGATSTGSTSLTVPAGTAFGAYYICAMADSNDTVNEGPNEGNNTLCTASTVQVSDPDLIMTSVSPNSSTATKGGTLSVTTTVQNTGPLASTAFRIAFRLSPNTVYGDSDDVTITAIRSVTSLAAGASSTGTTSLTIPTSTPSGTYYVCSKADSLNQVTELDEGNNTLCSDGAAITQVTIP